MATLAKCRIVTRTRTADWQYIAILFVASVQLPSGRMATTMAYDMEEYLDSCVKQYLELASRKYATRFVADNLLWESVL